MKAKQIFMFLLQHEEIFSNEESLEPTTHIDIFKVKMFKHKGELVCRGQISGMIILDK